MKMDTEKVVKQARRILKGMDNDHRRGAFEAQELIRIYAGESSSFYKNIAKVAEKLGSMNGDISYYASARQILEGFVDSLENGLFEDVSIERKAQIDVVSDFLSQAQTMLETKKIHPAAAATIIGASLEEFLRNWVEEKNLSAEGRSIDSYGKELKKERLITKQDMKDITAWAGIRNDAAHGNWEEVSDIKKISLMLEGVNLFMRKYGDKETI